MTHALEPQPRSRTVMIAIAAVVTLVVLGIVLALVLGGRRDQVPVDTPATVTQPPTAAQTTPAAVEATESTTAAPPPASVDPRLADCTDVSAGFVPKRFTIDSLGADEKVIALDLDESGNIAAPPFDQPRTASWWSGGPMPGDDKGQAVMSIHTYNPSLPPALGNEMYEGGKSQLKPGDVIKLYGDEGQVKCYEYTHDLKVWVDEYDPDSDVMVDFEGDPDLAIIICWDFDKGTRDWDSRIIFYADPVDVPAAG